MSTLASAGRWVVVVPVKRLDRAKTRLSTRTAAQRRALALAFAVDTVRTVLSCDAVSSVLVVTGDAHVRSAVEPLGARTLPDVVDGGLREALSLGADHVHGTDPDASLAVVVGDLPALRADELGLALAAASGHARSFVADAAGIGTTLLAVTRGTPLEPLFGPRSRAAHARSGAVEIALLGLPGLRRDVDTEVDLWDARRLGTGPDTTAALDGGS